MMYKQKLLSTIIILALLLPLFGPSIAVQGEQVATTVQSQIVIEEVADATLRSWEPDENFGGRDILDVSYSAPNQAVTLLRFDLSSLPAEAIIDSASLHLFLVDSGGLTTVSIGAYFVTSPWDESTVTWNTYLTAETLGINSNVDNENGSYKSWPITSYVQSWIDDPSTNNGVLLMGPNSGDAYGRWFGSHEFNSRVPQLEIEYHMPVLSGRVYEGALGDETTPIPGITVTLYCSNNSGVLGEPIHTTTTNAEGWYGLEVMEVCEFYQIIETDPEGYISVGANSVDGSVIESNWIEYSYPLAGKTLTGNKFWDIKPERLLHIISGPTVSDITANSAVINWQTDETADSLVHYDTLARLFREIAEDPSQTTNHEVLLEGLIPSTTYHFKVRSSDDVGNSVESEDFIFETLPGSDTRDPTVRIIDPGIVRETVKFQADADDDTGVKKVEFFWDGKSVFTDYSPPYEWVFSTDAGENGDHVLMVKVFDLSNNFSTSTKMVDVKYFDDQEAPKVNIFHPYDGYVIYGPGSEQVWVTVSDDSGWSDVELIIADSSGKNQIVVASGKFPVSPSKNINFWWDTTYFPTGSYIIGVQATDEDGKVGTDVIKVTVDNPTPPPQPNLVVTKHEVFRHAHTFAIELTVKNQGNAKASQIEIIDSLTGFQAFARHFNGVDYETDYDTNLRRTNVTIKDTMGLAPGSSRTYIIAAVPVLTHPNPPSPAIGNAIKLSYTGPTGSKYSTPVLTFEVFKTTQTAGSAPSEPLAQAHANAIKTSSYLIVTNPGMLSFHNPFQDDDQVLSAMAELAFVRKGVLGFLGGSNTDILLNWLIEPGGTWAKALNSNFGKVGLGYMLIVGETEIVPSWRRNITQVSWSNSNCNTYEVNLSDLPYADTGGSNAAPELIVGRIIGNDAIDLVNTIQNSLTGSFDRSDYLMVSGTDRDKYGNPTGIENNFVGSINELYSLINCVNCVTKVHLKDVASADQEDEYKDNASDKDVIVYQGHGGVDSWQSLFSSDITDPLDPLDFGSVNPVIYSSACLTGSYENHVSNINATGGCMYGGGDDNIAEAFLDQGAAVFVGSTEVSPVSINRSFVKAFFENYWKLTTDVGQALTNLKRAKWSSNNYTQLWMFEYNLYGDPKYGVAPGGNASDQALSQEASNTHLLPDSEVISEIDVVVPDFTVTPVADYHEVEIPGGDVLLEPGSYRLPFYTKTIQYPPGYEIQQVSMTDRSGLVTVPNSGLNIPINEMFIAQEELQGQDTARVAEGWVPEDQFSWRIMEDPDGTITLTIIMYPFYYDPNTTDVLFYKNFSFDIDYIVSPVTLTSMITDKDVYVQNELVQADVMLTNTEASQDVSVGAVIKKYPSGEFVAGLPLQSLDSLMDDASFGLTWDTDGFETGSYMLEVTLKNAENQVLDRITTTFQIGITDGQILQLDVTPQYFEIGDTINALVRFENTGSVDLSGTLHIKVFDPLGTLVEDYEKSFTDLAPGKILDHDAAWDSSGAERGDYGIVGYALYAGKSSEAIQIIISTELPGVYYLPLILLNAK